MLEPWFSNNRQDKTIADIFLHAHTTLHDLIKSGGSVVDVVIQDEFTHDVIARLPK
jgi:hypothetical protein